MNCLTIRFDRPLSDVALDCHSSSLTTTWATAATANHGAAVADPSIAELLQEIVDQCQTLEQRRQQSLGELRQLAIELAMAATAKVLHEEINADRYPFQQIVSSMLESYDRNEPVLVLMNPADIPQLQSAMNDPASVLTGNQIALRPDPQIQRGGCRLESSRFDLFLNVSLLINEIRHSLLESLQDVAVERRRPEATNSRLQRFPNRRSAS